MPLYDYRCAACGKIVEVRHGFDETHAGRCPSCGGELKRVFNPAPIVFKGSGFYVTDSRKKSSEAKRDGKSDAKAETKSDAKTDAKSDAKADSKPQSAEKKSDGAAGGSDAA